MILHCGVFNIQVCQYCSDLCMVFVGGMGRPTAFQQAQLCNILANTQLF